MHSRNPTGVLLGTVGLLLFTLASNGRAAEGTPQESAAVTVSAFVTMNSDAQHAVVDDLVQRATRGLLAETDMNGQLKQKEVRENERAMANLARALFEQDPDSERRPVGQATIPTMAAREARERSDTTVLSLMGSLVERAYKRYYTEEIKAWLPRRPPAFE